jgi:hypothetical protein
MRRDILNRKKHLSILLVLIIILSSFQIGFAVDLDNPTEYHMDVKLNPKESIVEGEQNVKFTNSYNGELKELVFHLYPNSYSSQETMPTIGGMYLQDGEQLKEEEKGYIKIQEVHINNKKVKYTADDQILKLKMEKPIKKGEKVDIRIKFTLKVPQGNQRIHHINDTYSLTNWYPILSIYDEKTKKWDENPYHPIGESNYSDVSNYYVKLTVPKNMVVAPTGTIVEEKIIGENKVLSLKAEKVRDFVILMSPNYKVKTKEVDGIKISHYYMKDQGKSGDKTAEIILDEVAKTVKFMNKTVGKYAYDELRIGETFLSGGAMEYPQVIQMGRYGDLSKVDLKDQAPFTIEAAVHETMHQWWYVGVGNNEFKEPFLDESLTVFMTAYYFEQEYGKYHENSVAYAVRNYIYPSTTLTLNSSVDEFKDWGNYGQVIYNGKGPAFFEDLRQRLGEEKFLEILQTYYERYLFKNATIDGLLGVIDEVGGKDIGKAMAEAIEDPNYYPQDIELTQEERMDLYRNMEKRQLKRMVEEKGLIIGSIVLRGLEGEKIVLVKPAYVKKGGPQDTDGFINFFKTNLEMEYGIDLEVLEEKKLTEEDKKENLVIIGYPKKHSLMKDLSSKLPIRMDLDTIDINGVSIKNENVSGSFIAENPYNPKKLALIIFMDEHEAATKADEPDLTYDTMYMYNPIYQNSNQFIINTGDIEIQGMYQ